MVYKWLVFKTPSCVSWVFLEPGEVIEYVVFLDQINYVNFTIPSPGLLCVHLIRWFGVKYRCIFLYAVLYFVEPEGQVKIQTMNKSIKRFYTPKHLRRDLLSNCCSQ